MTKAPFPHCDEFVLHAPGSCKYCDEYPEKQQERTLKNVNFTAENNPNKAKCPAEARRSLKDINKWSGNRPERVLTNVQK